MNCGWPADGHCNTAAHFVNTPARPGVHPKFVTGGELLGEWHDRLR